MSGESLTELGTGWACLQIIPTGKIKRERELAESDKDFQHKTSIVLKEVRETQVALKIVSELQKQNVNGLVELLSEVDELVRIFHSIQKKVRDKQVLE